MEENRRPSGPFKLYLLWPFITVVPLAFAAVWLLAHGHRNAGLIILIAAMVDLIVSTAIYLSGRRAVDREAARFFSDYESEQLKILHETDAPLAFALKNGRIVWMNDAFSAYLTPDDLKKPNLQMIAPEMNAIRRPSGDETITMDFEYCGREGELTLRSHPVSDMVKTRDLMHYAEEINEFYSVSLTDLTDLHTALREKDDSQLAAGMIYIDNYDELMEVIEEIRQSLVVALIEQEINQYVIEHNGLIKKTENDKYFFAVRKCDLAAMEADKFKLLEAVKEIDTGSTGHKATLAIGIGLDKTSYTQSSDNARSAISLALARGGDQAVIKDGDQTSYYGAKGEQSAKNTRVKARVKAHDLSELIMQKESIFIMGHKLADADSLGAAIGIFKIAASLERDAHIVIGTVTANLSPLFLTLKNDPLYPPDSFISPEEAVARASADSMVIVVDTNIPERVESERLLHICNTIVVFDHHRQTAFSIKNPTLSYIEPYASSASEMVTEVIQYTETKVKLTEQEANTLYAGIVIDTNNFMNRTGVRTFEAASVLRRAGANITYVRKIFRDDLEDYKEKAVIISRAEVYKERFAIATYDGEHSQSPTILGAQAANGLLDIDGIQASFVLTRYKDKIYVSARSIDEVNVQVLMEKLGGGGHINVAGTQFNHTNMQEAKQTIKSVIDQMIEAGNL